MIYTGLDRPAKTNAKTKNRRRVRSFGIACRTPEEIFSLVNRGFCRLFRANLPLFGSVLPNSAPTDIQAALRGFWRQVSQRRTDDGKAIC